MIGCGRRHPTVDDTIAKRAPVHGDFALQANISQRLRQIAGTGESYGYLTPVQAEALSLILVKVSRIVSGDPHHKDHWHDIAGYARLVEERLP